VSVLPILIVIGSKDLANEVTVLNRNFLDRLLRKARNTKKDFVCFLNFISFEFLLALIPTR